MPRDDSTPLRLKALRERAGLSMAKVARALGYRNASSYQRYEDADLFKKAFLPLPLVKGLVDILAGRGSPPIEQEEVLMLAGLEDLTGRQLRSLDDQRWVFCIGEAAAGTWRDTFEWPRDEWLPVALSVKDERFPRAKRAALRVQGDSMDLIYPSGSFVIFVRFDEIGRAPRLGDKVIVVRRRQDLMEATIKEYSKDARGKRWLIPRSSNPRHTAFAIDAPADDSSAIEVLGLIVGSQRLE